MRALVCVRVGRVLERCGGFRGSCLCFRVCVRMFKMSVGGRGSFTGGIVFYIGLRAWGVLHG